MVRNLNDAGWQFTLGDGGPSRRVNLPHTWNAKDGQDGGGNYFRGACWYRLRLPIARRDAGRQFVLRFEAAATVAEVFVNDRRVGEHRGAFTAFAFDVTDFIHPGADNEIAVRVDNSKFDDVPPLAGDFTIFGGLYRGVSLLVLDPFHISPLDQGGSGVRIVQRAISSESAEIELVAQVRNGRGRAPWLSYEIADGKGRIVANGERHISPFATGSTPVITVRIDHPHLWDGVRDPHLYRATVILHDENGATDVVSETFGVRTFAIDPDRGLILNGKPYQIRGVNRHQDRPDKGWAVSDADHDEDFRMIREMGATGVRLAHYPHAKHVYDLCDRLGLVVWAELPLVNDITKSQAFADNAKQQLREMIAQHANHPSIVAWSLYNELSMKEGTDFSAERKLVTELNDLAHELDPSRLTVGATHKQNLQQPVNWIPDATAFNRYFGWYQGRPQDWAAELDELNAMFPEKRIGISEYGAGASIFQHELNPVKPRTGESWHPEEWQSLCHEQAWLAMRDRRWLWGTFVWNMFDFAADERKEGDQPGRNDKGLVTYDRRTKKDAFYFYQASWRDDVPVLHIASKRFKPRPTTQPQDVKIYSNCDSVELFHNGRSLGVRHSGTRIFVWPGVTFVRSQNEFRAVGERGGRRVEDSCRWNASPGATTRVTLSH